MIDRSQLKQCIIDLLQTRSLVWLAGVRRTGKTTLCRSFPEATYLDCELPSVRAQLADPEHFWSKQKGMVFLDEVHRLQDPSGVLKVATDHYKQVKAVATGSSTLAARRKFKDTLTGRKRDLWLQPLLVSELEKANMLDLDKRMLNGGLPPAYLSSGLDDMFYREWLDSFWAKDVQELYSIDKKTSFLTLAELILRQSGEIFEASSFAKHCHISRQTVTNYLEILSETLFALVVRPFSKGRDNDIIKAPKVYGFDTGFVCFARGFDNLRPEDKGSLIVHLVLSELLHHFGKDVVCYWRDKQKHEIDFVLKPARGTAVHAIECKTSYQNFSPKNLSIFRRYYPEGNNYLCSQNVSQPLELKFGDLAVTALPIGMVNKIG